MNDRAFDYIATFALFIVVAILGLFVVLLVDSVVALWRWKDRHDQDEDESDWGGGGGGGWTDKPSGRPPGGGGPDRDMDKQFHEVADAVGKSVEIEKKTREKVLT